MPHSMPRWTGRGFALLSRPALLCGWAHASLYISAVGLCLVWPISVPLHPHTMPCAPVCTSRTNMLPGSWVCGGQCMWLLMWELNYGVTTTKPRTLYRSAACCPQMRQLVYQSAMFVTIRLFVWSIPSITNMEQQSTHALVQQLPTTHFPSQHECHQHP